MNVKIRKSPKDKGLSNILRNGTFQRSLICRFSDIWPKGDFVRYFRVSYLDFLCKCNLWTAFCIILQIFVVNLYFTIICRSKTTKSANDNIWHPQVNIPNKKFGTKVSQNLNFSIFFQILHERLIRRKFRRVDSNDSSLIKFRENGFPAIRTDTKEF